MEEGNQVALPETDLPTDQVELVVVKPESLMSEAEISERDILRHPEFMAKFFQQKLKGTSNLTMSEGLEKDRITWKHNKEKAEAILAQI